MLIKLEVIPADSNEYAVLIFAIGCAFIGLLAVFADLCFYLIRNQSLLGVKHGYKESIVFMVAWSFGAFIIGYVGQVLAIFQVNLLACATVGLSWPVVFVKIIEYLAEQKEIQKIADEGEQ